MKITLNRTAASLLVASILAAPVSAFACGYGMLQVTQAEHERAERRQTEQDHRKHTGAKIVGGTAAGGAVVGALAGGGKGALIGGAAGAGAGAIGNKVRKDKAVKKREQREQRDNPR